MIFFNSKKEQVVLNEKNEIARGGEGMILPISKNNKSVAKVYFPNISPITNSKFDYISRLNDIFVHPEELLFDKKGNIAAFTMPYLGVDYFSLYSILSPAGFKNKNFKEKDKIQFIELMIDAINNAHKNNVVIGDFNPYNIMVNEKKKLKIIDVDSFETPNNAHSGRLLEDIRDFKNQGKINKSSDYYALAVLSFNLLTHLHPYKGIHNKYLKISDRIMHNLSIISPNAQDIKIPKFYNPISDNSLLSQFKKIFCDDERFILQIGTQAAFVNPIVKKIIQTQLHSDVLNMKYVFENEEIERVFFAGNYGLVKKENIYHIFDSSNKGYLTEKELITCNKLTIAGEYLFKFENNSVYYRGINSKKDDFVKVTNIDLSDCLLVEQIENYLFVLKEDTMEYIDLSYVISNSVQITKTNCFSPSFKRKGSIMFNSGGKENILFSNKKSISITGFDFNPKHIQIHKNAGVFSYVDSNNNIKNKIFYIDNMKPKYSEDLTEDISAISLKTDGNLPMITYCTDEKINFITLDGFQKVLSIDCKEVSVDTKLFHTPSGIIAWEGNNVLLINKK